MLRYIGYAGYVLRHKWYVFREARKLGITKHGLLHDMDKFGPIRFYFYAHHFYDFWGRFKTNTRDKTGHYEAGMSGDWHFDIEVVNHVNENPHHWQYWAKKKARHIVGYGFEYSDPVPMPHVYLLEHVADMRGAGKAQGNPDILAYYRANGNKEILHPETRKELEMIIGYKG